ncbi:rcc01693 family protein [Jannaschia sp. 2305UL9-9]|uniref:rcc01693 family protein n=1 Tax=Jannaschia sp. 2305UL9-9 TaxID=3121638 RepID=UPI0035275B41
MSDATFDWPALMAVGMRGLGLAPRDFWALTPAELAFLLGHGDGKLPMDRAGLEALAARFPDSMGDEG